MMDLFEMIRSGTDCEIAYVFFDTALEYDATKRHLDELEEKYGVTIERRKAKKSIPAACREYGVPFISKDVSELMQRLQAHGFDWRDSREDATLEKYGRCKSALDWYFDTRPPALSGKNKFSIKRYKLLREFVMDNPPPFSISDKCCDYAKKYTSADFNKEFNPDLVVMGMRQAEGGRRAGTIKSCFTAANGNKSDIYRPLWFWSDADKAQYKAWRGIRYSDCYEVYGMKRTGCCGCPCNSRAEQELALIEQYEPNLVKAARKVFGASYAYRQQYQAFKQQK